MEVRRARARAHPVLALAVAALRAVAVHVARRGGRHGDRSQQDKQENTPLPPPSRSSMRTHKATMDPPKHRDTLTEWFFAQVTGSASLKRARRRLRCRRSTPPQLLLLPNRWHPALLALHGSAPTSRSLDRWKRIQMPALQALGPNQAAMRVGRQLQPRSYASRTRRPLSTGGKSCCLEIPSQLLMSTATGHRALHSADRMQLCERALA